MAKKSKLEKLDELIRDKHSSKLLKCSADDTNRLEQLEKDFSDDLEHY
jgi:hypothetical protein